MPLDDADLKKVGEMIAGALKPEALTAALQPIVAAAANSATEAAVKATVNHDHAAELAHAEVASTPKV